MRPPYPLRKDARASAEMRELLQDFVDDLEAMGCAPPDDWVDPCDREAIFGPFSSCLVDRNTGDAYVEWPNLAYLLKQARDLLRRGAPTRRRKEGP